MLLGFKTQFPWNEPTHFKEKILAGLNPSGVYAETGFVPKIHTIRDDPGERWKPDMSIQFAHGVRSPNLEIWYDSRGQERGGCTYVQSVHISPRQEIIWVDGSYLSWVQIEEFARNDGFENAARLFEWFSKGPFKVRKLIHWTEKRY